MINFFDFAVYRGLFELNAHSGCNLEHKVVAFNAADTRNYARSRHDQVSLLQGTMEVFQGFKALLLRASHHKIKDKKHHYNQGEEVPQDLTEAGAVRHDTGCRSLSQRFKSQKLETDD